MKKVLIWKDHDEGQSPEIYEELNAILKEHFELITAGLADGLCFDALGAYDTVVICGGEELRRSVEDRSLVVPLMTYVANGGGLLVLHEGIRMAELTELSNLLGGKGAGFEAPQQVTYVAPYVDPLGRSQGQVDHVIDDGIQAFTVTDKKGWFYVNLFSPFDQILRFQCEDYWFGCTCGWCQKYCLGRTAYLSPGYSPEIFRNVEYRKIVRNAVRWTAGEISQPESDYEMFPLLG